MKPGFFTMETVHAVMMETDLTKAKALALEAIRAQPDAKTENKSKAQIAIERATSVKALGITLTNFLLAHPSEGLKVL
jgi:hypothetical protein